MPSPTTISFEELAAIGVLQELNRLFLHPLGIAMAVQQEDDGSVSFHGFWDFRADPEGMLFSDDYLATASARNKRDSVMALWNSKAAARTALLRGTTVQSFPEGK